MKKVFRVWISLFLVLTMLPVSPFAGAERLPSESSGTQLEGMLLPLKTQIDASILQRIRQEEPLTETVNGVYIANAVERSGKSILTFFDFNQKKNVNYTYEYSYRVPKIVSDSAAAHEINKSILEEYQAQLAPHEGPIAAVYLGSVDWNCTIEDGLFLLRVNYHPYEIDGVSDELAFSRVYYFDSGSGKWLTVEEMLSQLGFSTSAVIAAAQKQLEHDFIYYWMQVSVEESDRVRREAWENTGMPKMTAEFSDLWYDGRYFVFSWAIDNGSAHGAVVQVRFDPQGKVLPLPGEAGYEELSPDNDREPGAGNTPAAVIGYPPRPVNFPKEYSMLNGPMENVSVRKNSFFTDEKDNLQMRFTVNEKVRLSTEELAAAFRSGRLPLTDYGLHDIRIVSSDPVPSDPADGTVLYFAGADGKGYSACYDVYNYPWGYWEILLPGGKNLRYPGGDFYSEIAWNAVIEDTCGPWMDKQYDVCYTYDDPREFFDYYPQISEAEMYINIENGLVTYMQFLPPDSL